MTSITNTAKPVLQAKNTHPDASPISGVAPPVHSRFKPGQSGNPRGRPNAGASIRDFLNEMGEWTPDQIKAVLNDPKAPATKVMAARTLFDALESPDMAVYEDLLNGSKTLEQLRAEGINTGHIQKYTRRVAADGTVTVTITLKDRSDRVIDRILDRTAGKPRQALQVEAPNQIGVRIELITREEMDQVEVVDGPPLGIDWHNTGHELSLCAPATE